MQRLSSWLIAVLAVSVFVAAGYVVTKKDPVPDAGMLLPVTGTSSAVTAISTPATNSTTATPTAPSTTAGSSSGGASSSSTSSGPRVVAFLGDDWTVGVGASRRTKRFSSQLCAQLGVTEKNFGSDGSGYAKASDSGGAYDARIDAVVAAEPDVVVVAGGRNDTSDYLPTLRNRIKALFAELRRRLPNATIVAVAPMWGDSDAPAELAPIAAAVKQYVTASGGSYLDIPDPVHGHPGYMATAADPDDQGYTAITKALAPRIRALLT